VLLLRTQVREQREEPLIQPSNCCIVNKEIRVHLLLDLNGWCVMKQPEPMTSHKKIGPRRNRSGVGED
jgi:hypothetical protein